ncbi:MAG: HlyD family secretion protein [Hyphomicrobiales bacterium]|nr:HlyD family secretion protein [Hyphomicrobiales bacterium]
MAESQPDNLSDAPAAPDAPAKPNPAKRGKSLKKPVLIGIAALFGLYGLWVLFGYLVEGRFMVSTDDSYVRADMAVIAAKVPGYVVSVPVTDNQMVKAGDVLALIDEGDYRLALQSAEARLATQEATISRIGNQMQAQQAMISQAEAQMRAAEGEVLRSAADLERAQKLVASDYGSRQRVDQAQADDTRVLKAGRAEAQASLKEVESGVAKARRDLMFAQVKAPFDGAIGNRAAQPGQYVQPGSRLMALVPLGSVYVEANFKETQLARIKIGQTARLTVDAAPARRIEGRVVGIAPASGALFSLLPPENATGNFTKIVQRFPVRISIERALIDEGFLRAGMSVVTTIDTRP